MRTSGSARPIGVFDSGIGGLTVFEALRRRCPGEDLVYFGDTAHLPYGSKSPEAVIRYSIEAVRFLLKSRIKALVVACNTASALALSEIQKTARVPVLGVIRPGAKAAAAATRGGRVGIIGTEATISSGAYSRALREIRPRLVIRGAACPLFVPLVEEGWWAHPVSEAVAREYLAPFKSARIDTLILGCTHYPLLSRVISRVMGPAVGLIDSAEQTALEAQQLMAEAKLSRSGVAGRHRFVVSDDPLRFRRLAAKFLAKPPAQVEVHRFE